MVYRTKCKPRHTLPAPQRRVSVKRWTKVVLQVSFARTLTNTGTAIERFIKLCFVSLVRTGGRMAHRRKRVDWHRGGQNLLAIHPTTFMIPYYRQNEKKCNNLAFEFHCANTRQDIYIFPSFISSFLCW